MHCAPKIKQTIDQLPGNMHFVEVGSNMGDCLMYALGTKPDSTGIAIEALPHLANLIQDTLDKNKLSHRAMVINTVVSNHTGQVLVQEIYFLKKHF